jgi:polyhydroxyalkanoate synthase
MAPFVAPAEALARLRREIDRTAVRARNGVKHLSGFSAAAVGQTPSAVVWRRDKVTLHRYASVAPDGPGSPVLLVMSLVTRPYVFDLRPGNSLVARLVEAGHDVYLLDWGIPDAVEAGNTLETYCDEYLPRAARAVLKTSGADGLTLFGYCLGGVLALLTTAGHPDLPVRRLALLATPLDFAELGPMANLLNNGRLQPEELLDETGNVPASTLLEGFRLMAPTGDVTTLLSLWNSLGDVEALAAHQALVRWSGDHIPFPGAVLLQITDLFVRGRCLVDGKVPLGGRVVDLGAITVPVLDIIGRKDHLVPRPASEPLASVLGNAQLDALHLPAGHAGLILGRKAQEKFIPAILEWLDDRRN